MTQARPRSPSSTILVTGPTGKVGRRLIPLLERRFDWGLSRSACDKGRILTLTLDILTFRYGAEPRQFRDRNVG